MIGKPLQISKYEALGNDMIVVDPATFDCHMTPAVARRLCDRHLGIGADGICLGPLEQTGQHFPMRFYNPDGTQAEKSGNGLRIFARYLVDAGYVDSDEFGILIHGERSWVKRLDDRNERFAITMGRISFRSQEIPLSGPAREATAEPVTVAGRPLVITAVTVGNPHCVLFDQPLDTILEAGPLLESHPLFPQRTNVQIVQVLDEHTLRIAIWERGAGHTLASGTSACATAAAAVRNGRCHSPVTVHMEGGTAVVAIDEHWRATLCGSVAAVFRGEIAADLAIELHRLAGDAPPAATY